MGLFSGVFFSLLQLSQIIGINNFTIGNVISGTLFALKLEQWITFTILFCFGSTGLIFLFLLRPAPEVIGQKVEKVKIILY
jgi:hypothetical protein